MRLQWCTAAALLLAATAAHGRVIYNPKRRWNLDEGNPGMKTRVNAKGLDEIKRVLVKALDESMTDVEGIKARSSFQDGTVKFTNIRVVSWEPATFTVLKPDPPNRLIYGFENGNMGIEGDFEALQGPFRVPGRIDGEAIGITAATTMEVEQDALGNTRVVSNSCKAVVADSTVELEPLGPLAEFVRPRLPAINNAIRAYFPRVLCSVIQRVVEGVGPAIITGGLLQTDLEKLLTSADDGPAVRRFAEGMIMDNSLVAEPIMTSDSMELHHKGEVRYIDDRIETPFYPKAMPDFPKSDRMIQIAISDYVFNTMLYHAYLNDRMNVRLATDTLEEPYVKFLRTTCDGELPPTADGEEPTFRESIIEKVCIGSLVPELDAAYPNQMAELVLLPHGIPEFVLKDDKGVMEMNGRMLTYVDEDGERKQVLVISTDSEWDVQLRFDESADKITGDFQVNKMDLAAHRTSLPAVDPANIRQITPVVRNLLAPEFSRILEKGFDLPFLKVIKLRNPTMRVIEGLVLIESDFELNEKGVSELLQPLIASQVSALG